MNIVYALMQVNIFLSIFLIVWQLQVAALFVSAVGVTVFHLIKVKKLKNEKLDCERKVSERNELLSYAKLSEQKAAREVELLNKHKSELIPKISHEIRTPMNAIMGMASLLNETQLTPEQREYITAIENSGERLLKVINDILMDDILEYSKVESGNELEEKDFDLRNSIEEVLDVFAVKAAKANLDLIYNIDNSIPPRIIGDAFRLRQILMNLVENAFKFTTKGEIFIGVKWAEQRDKSKIKLEFEVRDTGTGMTPEKLEQISEDLSQEEELSDDGSALGLELIICKRLVALMNGSIKAESVQNAGSSFKFTVRTVVSQQTMRTHASMEMTGLEGKKVLIVDDNTTFSGVLKNQLNDWKLNAAAANSAEQALEILNQNSAFDLVITDLKMPGKNGVQLTQAIKQLHPQLPVILFTNAGDESFTAHSALFSSVVSKPVKHHILSKQVFSGLQQKSSNTSVIREQNDKQKLSVEFAKQYPLTILVAEDDKLNQKFALKILSKLGYNAHIANNGQEVLELVSQRNYDIVFMDVQMPVMNGLDATKMIRLCLTEQPHIVAMTGNTMQGDREECIVAGMDDYISKPINLKDLVVVLEKCGLKVKQK